MSQFYTPITVAELDWNAEGLPISRAYGDVYFSNEGGLDEARHVFLQGNDLLMRLQRATCFTVGETGFGSGLNFLALWQLWEEVAPAEARLHFFSAEKHPLRREDMERIHALFPEVKEQAEALRQALPLVVPGYHRLVLADGRVTLTLMYGDALEMFREQEAQADAWFLDGFAPRLNPQLWSVELARELRRLSAAGATVATFSTSQATMEVLEAGGFSVSKIPGFGRKKHMLTGKTQGSEWQPVMLSSPKQVQVIGGGLAGASVAYALARRGCAVHVHETGAAGRASGNPCAVFYPGVTAGWLPETSFYFTGFSFSRLLVQEAAQRQQVAHDFCGMLLFPKPSDAEGRMQRVWQALQPAPEVFYPVDAAQASALAGVELPQEAFHFPHGGWVDIHAYTQALLSHPRITAQMHADETAPLTVLCHGLQPSAWFPDCAEYLHPVPGQISQLRLAPESGFTGLRCVLSYSGYMAPTSEGSVHLGATYEREKTLDAQEGMADNLAKLSRFMGKPLTVDEALGSWAGMRPVSRDRMPMVGKWRENVYMSMGHASRGLLSCGVSGEYIASLLFAEPLPVPRRIARMIDPHRFSHE